MSDPYFIRPARLDEGERLGEIEETAATIFADAGIFAEMHAECFPADELAKLIAQGQVWVACFDDDVAVGFVVVMTIEDGAHIDELDVMPDLGRRGIGAALLEHACEWAKVNGFPYATLSTYRDVPWNAPFYLKHGFRILEPEELPPEMLVIRKIEKQKGLPLDKRVIMRRELS